MVYQPCPPSRSVPQKPLPCTNRALHPVPYRRSPSRVPTVSSIPFRTLEAPPVYQPCPPSRSVPQKPLLCTNRAPHPFPYLRTSSCVPTVPLTPFRSSEAPPVYQPCPSPLSVPQKPLPCTNRAPHPVPYRRSPSCVPTMPLTSFCAANQPFLNRTLLTIFRRMTVICFCLHLMEIMSPLRTVSNQACDGSARWMNGSRSGVFGPDPTSEPCLNLSRHLARSRTLQS